MAWLNERTHLLETASEIAVLQFLCWRANPDADHHVWPSRATIAEHSCVSVRTVVSVMERLESRGLLVRGDQSFAAGIPANRRPVVWRIPVGAAVVEPVDNSAQGCNDFTATGVQGCNDCMPRGATIASLGCNGCTQKEKIKNKPKKQSRQRAREDLSPTLATVATRLAAEGFTQSQISRATARWHQRDDLRHPNALRFLAEDERDRDKACEEAWGSFADVFSGDPMIDDPWGEIARICATDATEELPIVIYPDSGFQAASVAEKGQKLCAV